MVMSTQIMAESARLMEQSIMLDAVQILDVGDPITVGIDVTRPLTPVGPEMPGLVQTTTLANAVESRVDSVYSVKVPLRAGLRAGQAVRVVRCLLEPALVGKTLLIDKVTQNGAASLTKGVASDFEQVNQEGKGGLS